MNQKTSSVVKFILLAAVLGFALKQWVIEPFTVPTGSMQPTIQIGQTVFVSKLFKNPYKRRDIVAFNFPNPAGERFVKRITALPNDSVYTNNGLYSTTQPATHALDYAAHKIPQKRDTVHLNSQNLSFYRPLITHYENTSLNALTTGQIFINNQEINIYTFHQNYYFLQGDNTQNSTDSRNWGPVPENLIFGKTLFVHSSE